MLWKLKLLKAGAAYANSRLHAVKAEVLVLARFLPCLSQLFNIIIVLTKGYKRSCPLSHFFKITDYLHVYKD